MIRIRLGTHLFVKVPRPEENEVTLSVFESRYDIYHCSFLRILTSTTQNLWAFVLLMDIKF